MTAEYIAGLVANISQYDQYTAFNDALWDTLSGLYSEQEAISDAVCQYSPYCPRNVFHNASLKAVHSQWSQTQWYPIRQCTEADRSHTDMVEELSFFIPIIWEDSMLTRCFYNAMLPAASRVESGFSFLTEECTIYLAA